MNGYKPFMPLFMKDISSLARAWNSLSGLAITVNLPLLPPQLFSYIEIIFSASRGNVIGIQSPGASFSHMHLK